MINNFMRILNFSEFSMNEKKERPVDLRGVNLQLNKFYQDANGNTTASFTTYDGGKTFKIQTNGNLPKTHKLVSIKLEDLSDDELTTIGKKFMIIFNRISTKNQKTKLKNFKIKKL